MKILNCRRTVVALAGLTCLLILGLTKAMDPCAHIVSIVVAIAAANSTQAIMGKKDV